MIGKKAGAAYDDAPWLIISTTRISIAEACPTMLILRLNMSSKVVVV